MVSSSKLNSVSSNNECEENREEEEVLGGFVEGEEAAAGRCS